MSEKDKELVFLGNFKYCFIRKRKYGFIKWVCTDKNCTSSIVTTTDKIFLHQSIGEHNHLVHSRQEIERHIWRKNCKRKSGDDISSRL